MSDVERDGKIEQGSSLYAALAHTATRTAALYFSRPVRLFRPSKGGGLSIDYSYYLSNLDCLSEWLDISSKSRIPEWCIPYTSVHAPIDKAAWCMYHKIRFLDRVCDNLLLVFGSS